MSNNQVLFLSYYDSTLLSRCPYFIPLGTVYCGTALEKSGVKVNTHIIDYANYYSDFENEINKVIKIINEKNIQIICISGLSVDYVKIRKLVTVLRKQKPYLVIILGGGCMSADPEFVIKNTEIDYGLMDEGDYTLPELVKGLLNHNNINNIPGLVYKKNQIVVNKSINVENLDQVDFPRYDLFPKFEKAIINSRIYPILLSRSCPFKCSFCFHTCGKTYRVRSINNVFDEIRLAEKKYKIKHLFVIDELFGANMDQLEQFTEELSKMQNITYNAQTRADLINKEKLIMLKKSGCRNISIGIESVNQSILDSMGKHLTKERITNALEDIIAAGLTTNGNIIIGDKNETFETATESIDWFEENYKRYNLNINHIQIYPGTDLFSYAVKTKKIDKEYFLLNAELEKDFIVNISKMSDEEYLSIYKRVNKNRFFTEQQKDYYF